MKKELTLATIAVMLLATPVFASQTHGNSDNAKENNGTTVSQQKTENAPRQVSADVKEVEDENEVTTTPTPTTEDKDDDKEVKAAVDSTECDPNASWSSHGQYVSCVAKLHLGAAVSAAARSDIGKKKHATLSTTPTVTPTITPTETPSATPTATLTPPITSSEGALTFAFAPLENLMKALSHLFSSIPFLHHNA